MTRPDRKVLSKLIITPSGGCGPSVCRIVLAIVGNKHRLEVTEKDFQSELHRWKVEVPAAEVERMFATLRRATVPAYPVSPLVCDGSHYELTIPGEFSELRLGWWTIAPSGAIELADFAEWMEMAAGARDTAPPNP